MLQIRQQRGLRFGRGDPERVKCCPGHHPWTDRGCECLGLKRSERPVLPSLNVAGGPVIQEHVAEDHCIGLGDGERLSHHAALADNGAKLDLEIEAT